MFVRFSKKRSGANPVDINAVTLEALQSLRKDFEDHDINITTRLALELPPIMGHKGQLREVIINLAQNSIDAMVAVVDGSRQLRIETSRNGARAITISVEDTGPGIDPKNYSQNLRRVRNDEIQRHGAGPCDIENDRRSPQGPDRRHARVAEMARASR